MYPYRPISALAEIVINLLAYGHVVIKNVDLFMNGNITSHPLEKRHSNDLSGPNWDVFASLMRTGRVTSLTSDPARGLDPARSFLSAAIDHCENRTYAGVRWLQFDEGRRQFCSRLVSTQLTLCSSTACWFRLFLSDTAGTNDWAIPIVLIHNAQS